MSTEALSIIQTAEALGISASTVYRKVADGTIPSFRIGRSIRVPSRFIETITRLPGELPARSRRIGSRNR